MEVQKSHTPAHFSPQSAETADPPRLHIQIHPHALHLRVMLERMGAHLAPEATLLIAAEWSRRIVNVVSVDPDGPRLKFARNVQSVTSGSDFSGKILRALTLLTLVVNKSRSSVRVVRKGNS